VADDNTNLIQAPDAEGMKKLMLTSDLAISSGGQTLFELARVGLPAIVVGVAENQRRNIQAWQKNEFIEYAGFWGEENLVENIRTKFLLFLDHEKRLQSRDVGRTLVTGSGARKIAGFLQEMLPE
jgi:spore coat polysaccharide biosynthesis predicted glycosyltransferase SpsG